MGSAEWGELLKGKLSKEMVILLQESIRLLDIPGHLVDILEENSIMSVEDLLGISRDKLECIDGIGGESVRIILKGLADRGFTSD